VTNDALNIMVDCAREHGSCHGARMTGAGFGGCAVALAAKDKTEEFVSAVSVLYKKKSGLDGNIYVCKASEGASVVEG
jgi:galactokinase